MRGVVCFVVLAALVALFSQPSPVSAAGVATAAIDFGDEWMKISLVKAGVPMEIVLNTESKRKTNTAVSLRGDKWSFSEEAVADCIKTPEIGYRYLLPLLGQLANSTVVQDYIKSFPHSKIEAHPVRGTVVFRQANDKVYTVEELVGMILRHAVTLAEKTAEQPVTGVVVTVPPFFTQAQRKAMLLAGKLARLNIMQLLNTNTAVALHYGVFRRAEFNETEQNILFYDMGATSTVASIVGFKTELEKGSTKTRYPQLAVRSVGYDATLGGLDIDLRLREHLNKLFLEKYKGKYKGDITKNARAQGKLLKEANRVKYILSVNTETYAQVEGLFEEIDFKAQVTREDLETLCADIFARTIKPIEDALAGASLQLSDITQFIIVGGGVRVPKIQQQLADFLKGKEIGKGINGDEAASLGAAYQAAVLSKSFKVLKFAVKDTTLFPIEVRYTKGPAEETASGSESSATEAEDSKAGDVSRVIFERFNVMPQKKLLPLRRVSNDVTFSLNYGNLTFLDDRSIDMLGGLNISVVSLAGVASAFEANNAADTKGVKVHFRLDESGIVQIVGAEAIFETMPPKTEETEDSATANNTTASAEDGAEEGSKDDASSTSGSSSTGSEDGAADDSKTATGSDEEKKAESSGSDSSSSSSDSTADSTNSTTESAKTAANDTASGNKTETTAPAKKKPQKKVVKINLSMTVDAKDFEELDNEELDHSMTAIADFERIEKERQARDEAQNILESLIYKIKDNVENPKFTAAAKESEVSKMSEDAGAAQLWLEDNGSTATALELQSKVRALNETVERVYFRLRDAQSRPDAIKKLKQVLNMSTTFMDKARANNETEGAEVWIKEDELKDLDRLATEGQEWLTDKLKQQSALTASDDPVLTTAAIETKVVRIERELTFLLKRPKPRPKPKAKVNSTVVNGTDEAGTGANKTVTLDDTKASGDSSDSEKASTDGKKKESGEENQKDAAADEEKKQFDKAKEKEDKKKKASKESKKEEKTKESKKEDKASKKEKKTTTTEAPSTSTKRSRRGRNKAEEQKQEDVRLELPGGDHEDL